MIYRCINEWRKIFQAFQLTILLKGNQILRVWLDTETIFQIRDYFL